MAKWLSHLLALDLGHLWWVAPHQGVVGPVVLTHCAGLCTGGCGLAWPGLGTVTSDVTLTTCSTCGPPAPLAPDRLLHAGESLVGISVKRSILRIEAPTDTEGVRLVARLCQFPLPTFSVLFLYSCFLSTGAFHPGFHTPQLGLVSEMRRGLCLLYGKLHVLFLYVNGVRVIVCTELFCVCH